MTNGSNTPDDDAAFERFRRADPARDAEPDLAALRRATERRITDPTFAVVDPPEQQDPGDDDAPTGGTSPDGVASDDAAHPGSARSPSPGSASTPDDGAASAARTGTSRSGWVVAAAVAGMLAVGVGGYVAGSYRDTPVLDSETADVADAPQQEAETFSDEAERDSAEQDGAGQDDADMDAEGPMAAEDAEGAPQDPGAVPVQFVDGGLPTEPRQGDAWIIDAEDDDAEPVLLGEYPTISAADAVARLSDPRFTSHLWPQPGAEDSADPPPIPSEPGAPLAWPVQEVRLVAAELTVGGYTHGDGDMWMLPTWILTDDQGQTWSVLAVTEDVLDFAAP